MTSAAKVRANRANALRSTGPKSGLGKSLVARNATKHGIFAKLPVVSGECADEWGEHRHGVIASLRPVGVLELALAEQVALVLWRLRRLHRHEIAITSTAVADSALPPRNPFPALGQFDRSGSTAENDLVWLRGEFQMVRSNLRVFAECAELVKRFSASTSEVVAWEHADVILRWAQSVVLDYPVREAESPLVSAPEFVKALGLSCGTAREHQWTIALLQKAVEFLAGTVPVPTMELVTRLRVELEAKAASCSREMTRLGGEVTAVQRRQEECHERAAGAALLPSTADLDRIMKYERHLQTTLVVLLRELERLQAASVRTATGRS